MDDNAMFRKISFFSQMDEHEVAGILDLMEQIEFKAGDIIIEQGDVGDLFYVLTQGEVKIVVLDDDGGEVIVEEVFPGGLFGEISMITGEPRSARAQAVEDSVALALGREDFINFLLKYPHA